MFISILTYGPHSIGPTITSHHSPHPFTPGATCPPEKNPIRSRSSSRSKFPKGKFPKRSFPKEQFLEQNVEQRRHGQAAGTQGHQVSPTPAEPVVRRLDAVTPRPTRWLWPGRVALGQVTLVAGEPGAGSSLLLMDLASRVTRGRALPGSALPPTIPHDAAKAESVVAKAEGATSEPDLESPGGLRRGTCAAGRLADGGTVDRALEATDVVLIMRQSMMENVVAPRLATLGADMSRIHALGEVPVRDEAEDDDEEDDDEEDDDEEDEKEPTMRPFRADKDLGHLESLLTRTPGVKLVVLDPMELWLDERGQRMSYLSRETIGKLGELARQWDVAIVVAARVPDRPGANDLRRWLDKLAGVEELGALFAVVRDRRRPCRRYLAAAKNTLADMDDALLFETPEGRVVWGRRHVSAAVSWATASRLDQEDAARWLRDELALGPKTAKELRAAADEAGIPWHVVYRAKGIAGADCGRVGGGAGSYFVWSLFDLFEEEEETQENAKSSIENTKTREESAEQEADPRGGYPGAEPTGPEGESAERAGPTEASGNEIEESQESAKSSIENRKRGVARGDRGRQPPSRRRPRAEAKGEAARAQNEFSDPTTDTERQESCDAPSAQPVEQSSTRKVTGRTRDDGRLWVLYGDSPPELVSELSSDRLWNMLTKEYNGSELKQEIERVLRERSDPKMKDEMKEEMNDEGWVMHRWRDV